MVEIYFLILWRSIGDYSHAIHLIKTYGRVRFVVCYFIQISHLVEVTSNRSNIFICTYIPTYLPLRVYLILTNHFNIFVIFIVISVNEETEKKTAAVAASDHSVCPKFDNNFGLLMCVFGHKISSLCMNIVYFWPLLCVT